MLPWIIQTSHFSKEFHFNSHTFLKGNISPYHCFSIFVFCIKTESNNNSFSCYFIWQILDAISVYNIFGKMTLEEDIKDVSLNNERQNWTLSPNMRYNKIYDFGVFFGKTKSTLFHENSLRHI